MDQIKSARYIFLLHLPLSRGRMARNITDTATTTAKKKEKNEHIFFHTSPLEGKEKEIKQLLKTFLKF